MSLRVPFVGIATAAVVVLLLLVSGLPASAKMEISEQDRHFLRQAHQGNLAEIAAGKTAQDKGESDTVRSIGAILVADHTKLDTSLKRTARRLGVSLPSEPSAEQKAEHERLASLSGSAFDRAWITAMIEGHRGALGLGRQELQTGSSPDVKGVAESSAPVIQGHLDRLLRAQGHLAGQTG
ncbi:MAG: hypothetical protein JWQ95_5405 [Sphaerisporangium sp.]|jgi:putative membrane protein|nr:hypothetical protein [Sphaerisporangium sp.]